MGTGYPILIIYFKMLLETREGNNFYPSTQSIAAARAHKKHCTSSWLLCTHSERCGGTNERQGKTPMEKPVI